ncbi:MAG: hypothetical protein ABSB09_11585 [Acidimicrobiales bacterium]|jgi:hypothetical protein
MTTPGPPATDPGTGTAVRDPLEVPGPVVDPTDDGSSERLRGLDARPGVPVAVLVAAYALSRIAGAVAGVRYDDSVIRGTPLTDMWQLLDVRLLKDDLVTSVWHLNSQPPLFNLYCGFLLKLPGGARRPVEVACVLALGLTMVLCAYLVMVELRVPRWAALTVTLVCVVASPAYLLYENWLNYAYPAAAFGTLAAWCLIRFLRTARARFGFGFFAAYAAIVLVDSTYQVEWFLLAGVIVLVALRHRWRTVLAVAAVPVILLATWTVKDYVLFGTTTTSSWLGMNLARSILYRAPADQIAQLQRQGRMNAVASIPPFAGPQVYSPRYVRAVPNPVAAVGELYKSDGATNFNNPLYITVSSMYLHDDLVWIRAHPHEYADDVLNAVGVWMVGTDQNFTDSINWPSVRTYARAYDRVVEWQPVQDPAPGFVVFSRGWHRPAWLSGQAMAVYALAVIGVPVLAWRRRRSDPALAATLGVLWWTTTYAFATGSLIEIGENERFRSELGPVPTILAVIVVTAVIRAGWERWQRRRLARVAVDR